MKEDVLPFFIKDIQDSTKVKVHTTPLKDIFQWPSIIICAGSSTLRQVGYAFDIVHEDTNQHYTPDINKFFSSFSMYSSDFNVQVYILSGIGNDGVRGASLLKSNGAKVIAESEKSSAVFGMPRAAIELGIVEEIKSLAQIVDYFKELR